MTSVNPLIPTYEPLISVVTPVYNGEPFLPECIESVLSQDYSNWEYIIVNNRSTDRSLEVAQSYARQDPRISVVTNEVFVNAEENHNNCFRRISGRSEYCKVVSADDWLFPGCLTRMVRFGVAHPSVGIIGSYQQSGDGLKWQGLAAETSVLSGREVCRLGLLKGVHVVGTPTSSLYRADIVRRSRSFFPHGEAHADTSACYAHLHDCDYGFIHEALSAERTHPGQITAGVERLSAGDLAYLDILIQYGPLYLTEAELCQQLERTIAEYYRVMGGYVWKLKDREFWTFHRSRLRTLGYPLSVGRLALHALCAPARALLNPRRAAKAIRLPFTRNRHARPA
jgi:glycosyltransferase involved in cell wall biosynthesis